MYVSEIRVENFRTFGHGSNAFTLPLRPGLTAIIGENDTGKTALIDALRFVFGTRDQQYYRIQEDDFHWPSGAAERSKEIRIRCRIEGLTTRDKGAFAEFLTYTEHDGVHDAVLFVHWIARNQNKGRSARRSIFAELRTGKDGNGPTLHQEARELLRATYLRPLRDAERALTEGRGSRLAEILRNTGEVKSEGVPYDENAPLDVDALSLLGVGDYASGLMREREGIKKAENRLNKNYLKPLSFAGDTLEGKISVGQGGDDDMRLRQLLERFHLQLRSANQTVSANRGLGSNNLLFIACELLLLGDEGVGLPLLLIEEPEAHIHPQRQLRLMRFLTEKAAPAVAGGEDVQVLITTHSPNLASAIPLDNLVLLQGRKAFSLARDMTRLDRSDYRFLERFLDVTKANLFFARGVVIVEGDAENILLPTIARLIGRDFAEHGVSIVNVGTTGLGRFARIFHRADPAKDGEVSVPVACLADMDVMPDCAPEILGKEDRQGRQWKKKSDFEEGGLEHRRADIESRASGQQVRTFVADNWTLEYDLAHSGLAKAVWIAARLAQADNAINKGTKTVLEVWSEAKVDYEAMSPSDIETEMLCSQIYKEFAVGKKASKAITAQYLADILERLSRMNLLDAKKLREKLPTYILASIEYVTGGSTQNEGQQAEPSGPGAPID